MKNKLNQITEKAKRDKRLKFTSLIHHINEANLVRCYSELKKDKASGIDGITVEEYGRNLEKNISLLVGKLKSKEYRPQPVRRVCIPKAGSDEKRGLGIPAVEDKLVQIMLKRILEAIFETDFVDFSYGFRPKRNCTKAIMRLNEEVMHKPINFIVEVDIRKFFDRVSHYWLQRCLEERIADHNLLWLVRRFLKAGVIEDGEFQASELGTPQGRSFASLITKKPAAFIKKLL
ncbi:MAG TPA: reverse transcriptase [Coxiellaceae bacterium]|nr:reverse transcriptase [Coxiellaceae bacterium]HBY55926.1 reverse transcriptase [Coxiellaceae bacterium]